MEGGDGAKMSESKCWKEKGHVGQVSKGQVEDSGEHPCGVCRKEVGKNSILCVQYNANECFQLSPS